MSEQQIKVRVERNRFGVARESQPWLVRCPTCGGANFFEEMLGGTVLGFALTWRRAQDYATRHALAHEKTRCPSCLHVPQEKLADERTNA